MAKLPKFQVNHDKARAARGHSPWRVTIPATYSETGQRTHKYYPTKKAAEASAAALTSKALTLGSLGSSATQEEILILHVLTERLAGDDMTPVQAISSYLDLLDAYGTPAEIKRLAALGAEADTSGKATVQLVEALQALYDAKDARQSSHTVASRRTRFARLLERNPQLATQTMRAITPQDVDRALDAAHPHQDTSWNNLFREFSSLFTFAIRRGWCDSNPLEKLEKRTVREQEITAITPASLLSLFRACRRPQPQDRAGDTPYEIRVARQDTRGLQLYLALMAFGGIRPVECTRLTWGDISLHEGVISIRPTHSKTGGARHVTIRPVLRAWLLACRPQEVDDDTPAISTLDLKFKMIALRRRAGYDEEQNPWQDDALRHSFATYLLKNGEDLTRIVMDMGHSSTLLLRTRYLNPRGITPTSAREWWRLTPYRVFSSTQKAPE